MHDLQSYNFFGKRMVMILDSFLQEIQYAKNPSDSALKAKGEFDKFTVKKRFQHKKEEEAKERQSRRNDMQQELELVKEDLDDIKDQLLSKREEDRRELLDSAKTTLTVENIPAEADEGFLKSVFSK